MIAVVVATVSHCGHIMEALKCQSTEYGFHPTARENHERLLIRGTNKLNQMIRVMNKTGWARWSELDRGEEEAEET